MSVEELLKPRYKVVADYPNSIYTVGEIIQQSGQDFFNTIFFERYPHIFLEISWYDERYREDLPIYLKRQKGNIIYKVKSYSANMYYVYFTHTKYREAINLFVPATEQEYLNYINKI